MSWADINPDATAQLVKGVGGDGWSILSKNFFEKYLHASEITTVVEPLVKSHKSDYSHPKLTIFKEGYPVQSIEGVHALDLLYTIANDLDLSETLNNASAKMGRGFQAQELTEGILNHLP
tara:strand:+ start:2643 stop:3002 length:360 start_codon:yes stop_codon:yes gene_type:complete